MSFQDADSSTVKAWNPLVRVFHGSLVFFFLLTFLTGSMVTGRKKYRSNWADVDPGNGKEIQS
jgi:cytochrome b subunit of formate dehydrogenase